MASYPAMGSQKQTLLLWSEVVRSISLPRQRRRAALPEAEDIALDILYEDEAMIVINKPGGMVVHPTPGALATARWSMPCLAHCGDSLTGIGGLRPGIVHRLDKYTSG